MGHSKGQIVTGIFATVFALLVWLVSYYQIHLANLARRQCSRYPRPCRLHTPFTNEFNRKLRRHTFAVLSLQIIQSVLMLSLLLRPPSQPSEAVQKTIVAGFVFNRVAIRLECTYILAIILGSFYESVNKSRLRSYKAVDHRLRQFFILLFLVLNVLTIITNSDLYELIGGICFLVCYLLWQWLNFVRLLWLVSQELGEVLTTAAADAQSPSVSNVRSALRKLRIAAITSFILLVFGAAYAAQQRRCDIITRLYRSHNLISLQEIRNYEPGYMYDRILEDDFLLPVATVLIVLPVMYFIHVGWSIPRKECGQLKVKFTTKAKEANNGEEEKVQSLPKKPREQGQEQGQRQRQEKEPKLYSAKKSSSSGSWSWTHKIRVFGLSRVSEERSSPNSFNNDTNNSSGSMVKESEQENDITVASAVAMESAVATRQVSVSELPFVESGIMVEMGTWHDWQSGSDRYTQKEQDSKKARPRPYGESVPEKNTDSLLSRPRSLSSSALRSGQNNNIEDHASHRTDNSSSPASGAHVNNDSSPSATRRNLERQSFSTISGPSYHSDRMSLSSGDEEMQRSRQTSQESLSNDSSNSHSHPVAVVMPGTPQETERQLHHVAIVIPVTPPQTQRRLHHTPPLTQRQLHHTPPLTPERFTRHLNH